MLWCNTKSVEAREVFQEPKTEMIISSFIKPTQLTGTLLKFNMNFKILGLTAQLSIITLIILKVYMT